MNKIILPFKSSKCKMLLKNCNRPPLPFFWFLGCPAIHISNFSSLRGFNTTVPLNQADISLLHLIKSHYNRALQPFASLQQSCCFRYHNWTTLIFLPQILDYDSKVIRRICHPTSAGSATSNFLHLLANSFEWKSGNTFPQYCKIYTDGNLINDHFFNVKLFPLGRILEELLLKKRIFFWFRHHADTCQRSRHFFNSILLFYDVHLIGLSHQPPV